MKKNIFVVLLIVVLVIAAYILFSGESSDSLEGQQPDTSDQLSDSYTTTVGGQLRFETPADFGLALNQDQILVSSYIPPCSEGFDYCLYYNGSEYAGTNFESAGVRIEKRSDLTVKNACLTTMPEGYNNLTPELREGDGYTLSQFSPLGDAAAGHYSTGSLYRLYFDSSCYEFETRIGESQFANYEPGSIKEFTAADKAAMQAKLSSVLNKVRFASDTSEVVF